MKTFTPVLIGNRLLTSVFSCFLIFITAPTTALHSVQDLLVSNEVEFASLSATANDKTVFISWVTAEERNNSHFEVERSTDNKDFTTVALVLDGFAAKGTGKTYKFKEDAGEVKKGKTVYYRLKQVDTNAQVHYSKVLAVQMNTTVTLVAAREDQNRNSASAVNKFKLLSKQSASNSGRDDVLTGRSYGLSAGTSFGLVFMTELELGFPKLVFA